MSSNNKSNNGSGTFWVLLIIGLIFIMAYESYASKIPQEVKGVNTKSSIKTSIAGVLPNPSLTPGDILPATKEQICVPGYAGNTRNVSTALKIQVYKEYNIPYPQPTGAIEVDHLISLQLGGSNDIKNLWPEKASTVPGFHEKDLVETYLHKELCQGRKTLKQVQEVISTDWTVAYREYLSKK
jgi:hypothetical protein